MKQQMASQGVQLQWLITRLGGVEDAGASLPDGISLPCLTLQELESLESQVADGTVRAKLVNNRCQNNALLS